MKIFEFLMLKKDINKNLAYGFRVINRNHEILIAHFFAFNTP